MKAARIMLTLFSATLFALGCADEAVVSPELASDETSTGSSGSVQAASVQVEAEPFTFRAPLDPFRINQAPEFMMRSGATRDIIIQRLVFPPGVGAWHTHPGPSFSIVVQGQVQLTRYSKKDGCTLSEIYGPGDAYYEIADEVHRVTVLGPEDAIEHKVRFNVPVGGAFSTPAEDPGC